MSYILGLKEIAKELGRIADALYALGEPKKMQAPAAVQQGPIVPGPIQNLWAAPNAKTEDDAPLQGPKTSQQIYETTFVKDPRDL